MIHLSPMLFPNTHSFQLFIYQSLLSLAITMKNIITLVALSLFTLSTADVHQYTDTQCTEGSTLVSTTAGTCISYLGGGWESAKGCSLTHDLRVYAEPNCDETGIYNTIGPHNCINLGMTDALLKVPNFVAYAGQSSP